MLRRLALAVLVPTILVGCTNAQVANAVLGPAEKQNAFYAGVREQAVKQGLTAAQADCTVAGIKAAFTQADVDAIINSPESAPLTQHQQEVIAAATLKCAATGTP